MMKKMIMVLMLTACSLAVNALHVLDWVDATGYTNVYDAAEHTIWVKAPMPDTEEYPDAITDVKFSLNKNGPYGAKPYFKDVTNTVVWFVVSIPGYYPATNKVGVVITKAPLTIRANDGNEIYNGQAANNNGVVYEGFAGDENENTPGVLTGELKYDYGDYGECAVVGDYAIRPGGLSARNYEITYVAGKLPVKSFEDDEAEEVEIRLDLRKGVRETDGEELLAYSPFWTGGENATVSLTVEGYGVPDETLAAGLTGEGEFLWQEERPRMFTLKHTTYVNGIAKEELIAEFITAPMGDVIAEGYTNVYDGAEHVLKVTPPESSEPGYSSEVAYSLSQRGPYVPEPFVFKDVTNAVVWYVVTVPGYYPVTNKVGVVITKAPLTIRANDGNEIYNGQAANNNGVVYEGFAGKENENMPGVLTGELKYDYGDYGECAVVGDYAIRPGGLSARNYEITYVAGKLPVKSFENDEAEEVAIRLDLRVGARELTGPEEITYSTLWSGDENSTVTLSVGGYNVDDVPVATKLRGEGEFVWSDNRKRAYTLRHTTYTNGVPGKVLSAEFVIPPAVYDASMVYAVSGFGGGFDGTGHGIAITVAEGAMVLYSLEKDGVYTAECPTLCEIGTMRVWYRVEKAGYEPVTGYADVVVNPGDIEYSVDDVTGTYCGEGYAVVPEVTAPATGVKIEYAETAGDPWRTKLAYTNACTAKPMYFRLSAEKYDTVIGSANVTVLPKKLTLTSPTKTKTYDGTELTFDVSEIVADGYVDGEMLDYTDIASITEAGVTNATFTVAASETAKTGNYDVTYEYGILKVEKPAPVDPDPVEPEPVNPEPVDPEPVDPDPVNPEPVDPDPVDPDPVNPEPVDPDPVNPEPQVEPAPVDPEPEQPAEMATAQIGDLQSTAITETFDGAGTLMFRWKVSSEPGCDFFVVYIDGEEYAAISGERDWEGVAIPIASEGRHVVKWVYTKDESFARGEDRGWVKDVEWIPGKPAEEEMPALPSPDMPCLDRAGYVFETFVGFGVDEQYEIYNQQAKTVTLKKVGKGKLPAGIKLKYDKKSGMVLLSGAATKAGEYEYVMHIEEKAGKVKRIGPDTSFKFVVRDAAKLPPGDRDFNAAAGKKIKVDLPVLSCSGIYAGNLSVSVTTKGAITAKIKGVTKKVLSFKGNWQSINDGSMSARLVTKTGEQLKIVLMKNGNLCASLSGGALGEVLASDSHGVKAAATAADYKDYAGAHEIEVDGIKFTLKIAKTGKVTYAPADKTDKAHKAYKGTAQLLLNAYEDGTAQVWLVKQTKTLAYAYEVRVE